MTRPGETGLYFGKVVHARMRPVRHALRYSVFSLVFDLDGIDALERRVKLFSRNRFNLVSLHDADFGKGGARLIDHARSIADEAGLGEVVTRFSLLAYPRILGFAFNPLSVYFGYDADDRLRLTIYEVNNTFGDRRTYAIPAHPDATGMVWQSCPKQMFVSPFNDVSGTYSFHLTPLAETVTLGVALKDEEGPKLRAHFRGDRQELTDATLVKALLRTGWMTVKVYAGIHIEALRLWLKGLRLKKRPAAPDKPLTIFRDQKARGESGAGRRAA